MNNNSKDSLKSKKRVLSPPSPTSVHVVKSQSKSHKTSDDNNNTFITSSSPLLKPLKIDLDVSIRNSKDLEANLNSPQVVIPPSEETDQEIFSPIYNIDSNEHYEKVDEIQETNSSLQQPQPQPHPPSSSSTTTTTQDDESKSQKVYPDYHPFYFIRALPPLSQQGLSRPILLPKRTRSCKHLKTLVLDLDETLVHCSTMPLDPFDLQFPVNFNGIQYTVSCRTRPHYLDFLKQVSEMFEVVVFTASQKIYADQLLDLLDPEKKYIKHRLFRDSCLYWGGNYMKDLSVLGRDLAQTIIVDNSPQAFGYQIDNGIPIASWYEDKQDVELLHLLDFLKQLSNESDVRPLIRKEFKLHERIFASI